ncbi:MAG: PAS domain S-box protein [Candidatus Hodarchaeales archaeon]|jgi:PAS domain S-box-containing protein
MLYAITLNQWLGVFVALLGTITIPILIRQYFKTKIKDYLIFSTFFLSGIIILIADPIAGATDLLIFYQIHHIAIDIAFFLLLLHAIRLMDNRFNSIFWYLGIIWLSLLVFLTLLWSPMIQPETATVLFLDLPHGFSSYYPRGAGLVSADGSIIYSTGFRYIGELYRLYCLGFLLYAYITVKPVLPSERIRRARKLWIIVWIMILIHALSLFPWLNITEDVSIFLIIAGAFMLYLPIKYPEALLISHPQVLRIKELYYKIQDEKSLGENLGYTAESIFAYLNNIPSDFFESVELPEFLRLFQHAQQKFDLLAENISDVVWTFNKDFKITYVSPSIQKLCGSEPSEVLNQRLSEIYTSESFSLITKKTEKIMQNISEGKKPKSPIIVEIEKLCRYGSSIWIETIIEPIIDEKGNLEYYLCISRDISYRMKSQKALKESEERYKNLTNISSEGIAYYYQGTFLDVNKAFCELTGYKREELINKDVIKILIPEELREVVVQYAQSKDDSRYETTIVRENGRQIPIEVFSRVVNYPRENARVVIVRDISKHKEIEKSLKEAKQKAEEINQAKTNFIANMSHEFRTPLNGILGVTELLYMSQLSEDQLKYVKILERSSENLLQLVNDLLDLSRIERGIFTLNKMEFNIKTTLDNIVNILNPLAMKKGLTLNLIYETDIPEFLIGDPIRVEQILLNLTHNAVKFTNEGIIELIVNTRTENGYKNNQILVEFQIRDTGIGIEKNQLKKIFNPFYQTNMTYTKQNKGTGLGLSIANQLAQLMEGEITVASEIGKGSTFSFKAPYTSVIEIQNKRSLFSKEIDVNTFDHPFTILIAEDNEDNLEILTILLKKLTPNIKIIKAENGLVAVEKYNRNKIDIIFMDIQMPLMNGLEATKEIRKIEQKNGDKIPVIAVTGFVMENDKSNYLQNGISDYLSKPFSINQIETILTKWIIQNNPSI